MQFKVLSTLVLIAVPSVLGNSMNISGSQISKQESDQQQIDIQKSADDVGHVHPPEQDEDPCTICLEKFKIDEALVKTRCKHWFHEVCWDNWKKHKSTCPVCRTNLGAPAQNQQRIVAVPNRDPKWWYAFVGNSVLVIFSIIFFVVVSLICTMADGTYDENLVFVVSIRLATFFVTIFAVACVCIFVGLLWSYIQRWSYIDLLEVEQLHPILSRLPFVVFFFLWILDSMISQDPKNLISYIKGMSPNALKSLKKAVEEQDMEDKGPSNVLKQLDMKEELDDVKKELDDVKEKLVKLLDVEEFSEFILNYRGNTKLRMISVVALMSSVVLFYWGQKEFQGNDTYIQLMYIALCAVYTVILIFETYCHSEFMFALVSQEDPHRHP